MMPLQMASGNTGASFFAVKKMVLNKCFSYIYSCVAKEFWHIKDQRCRKYDTKGTYSIQFNSIQICLLKLL